MSPTLCFASAHWSCELTRWCLFVSLQTARSLLRLRIKPKNATNKHADGAQPQHVFLQHARVLRKTPCVCGLGFAFVLGRDCVLESLLSVSLWSSVVRWLTIDKFTLWGCRRVQSPCFGEDRFVLTSQTEVFFFVGRGIP